VSWFRGRVRWEGAYVDQPLEDDLKVGERKEVEALEELVERTREQVEAGDDGGKGGTGAASGEEEVWVRGG
jgi:hypothetical protein